jgi:hypothetical protein
VLVDSIAQAVDVLGIYLRKTIDNVKIVPAQGKLNVFGKYPVLQSGEFYRDLYIMKKNPFQWFIAVGKNMDFMAEIS